MEYTRANSETEMIDAIVAKLQICPGDMVLTISKPGTRKIFLGVLNKLRPGSRVVYVTPNADSVDKVKELALKRGLERIVDCHCGSLEDIPGTYDWVVMSSILPCEDPTEILTAGYNAAIEGMVVVQPEVSATTVHSKYHLCGVNPFLEYASLVDEDTRQLNDIEAFFRQRRRFSQLSCHEDSFMRDYDFLQRVVTVLTDNSKLADTKAEKWLKGIEGVAVTPVHVWYGVKPAAR